MKIRQKTKKLQNLKNPPHLGRERPERNQGFGEITSMLIRRSTKEKN